MADTKHPKPGGSPVEGDGVSYSGIVWFTVILTGVTVVCQVLMWGLFAALKTQTDGKDLARSPHAAPSLQAPPGPNLLAVAPDRPTEPGYLHEFLAREDAILNGPPAWADRNAGTVRIPIDRAMDLILERGLPARGEIKK